MDDTTLLWILGGFAATIAAGVTAYVSIAQRVTKLETLVSLFNKNIAKALHSPTNHHGLDEYLEKYEKNFDLSYDEWVKVKAITDEIIACKDDTYTHGEKVGFSWINAQAQHKLMRKFQEAPAVVLLIWFIGFVAVLFHFTGVF